MGIAKGLGKPIKVDLTTLRFERARYARICVEVNLNKPLKGTVMVNGERYFVSYEGISAICSTCGMYGHLVHACPRNVTEKALAPVPTPVITSLVTHNSTEMEMEFTQVRHARRKPEQHKNIGTSLGGKDGSGTVGRKTSEVSKERVLEEIRTSNKFGGLNEEGVMEENVEVAVREEENKENENSINLRAGGSRERNGKKMMFAANGNKGNQTSVRMGLKERKGSNWKSPNFQKPKSKSAGPTRGLVFGPTKGEIELSVSGKRLRVEKESVGRPGGAFSGDGDLDGAERDPDHGYKQRNMQAQVERKESLQLEESEVRVGRAGESSMNVEA